ncbi:hypothetical protein VN12_12475 [Pirellula sp. SH-Sr6A]|nr:hypothetical protein VN12_12475 [Pirellula sp. SH-Sr6A]
MEKNEFPHGNRVLCCRAVDMTSSIPIRSERNYPENRCIQTQATRFRQFTTARFTKSPGGDLLDESTDYLA